MDFVLREFVVSTPKSLEKTLANLPSDLYFPELTGVTEFILSEDFLVTAAATGGPFCRGTSEALGWTTKDIPLIYVPFMALGYALKKGKKVLVKFSQDDIRYPYLWFQSPDAWDSNTTSGYLANFPVPTASAPAPDSSLSPSLVFPDQSESADYSFNILGNGLIVASNENYTAIVFTDPAGGSNQQAFYFTKDGMTLYSPAGKIGFQGSTMTAVVGPATLDVDKDGNINVTGMKSMNLTTTTGTGPSHLVTFEELKAAMDTLYSALTTTPIYGNGAPQTTWTGLSPATKIDITAAKVPNITVDHS